MAYKFNNKINKKKKNYKNIIIKKKFLNFS